MTDAEDMLTAADFRGRASYGVRCQSHFDIMTFAASGRRRLQMIYRAANILVEGFSQECFAPHATGSTAYVEAG